jgi:hypothetical protein
MTKPPPGFTRDAAISSFAEHILRGTADAPQVVFGPIVWEPSQKDGRHWYFPIASTDAAGKFRIDCFRVAEDNRTLAEESRAALMLELIKRRPVVMHDFDDELRMAKFCEAAFPCKKTRDIRAGIERERSH